MEKPSQSERNWSARMQFDGISHLPAEWGRAPPPPPPPLSAAARAEAGAAEAIAHEVDFEAAVAAGQPVLRQQRHHALALVDRAHERHLPRGAQAQAAGSARAGKREDSAPAGRAISATLSSPMSRMTRRSASHSSSNAPRKLGAL